MPVVMDADRISRTITRIAHEIVERGRPLDEYALVGVRSRGVPIARRIAAAVHQIAGCSCPLAASTSRSTATT